MERHGTVDFALTDDSATPDALADLFLSEPEPGTRRAGPAVRVGADDASRAMEGPAIEGIMLGNLPVMGGAWVGQYAKHVADTTQMPAALMRVLGGEASLDLVLPRGQTTRLASRVGGGGGGVTGDLVSAVDAAAGEAATWLVRLDEEQDADLLALPGLTRLTVLTGADDAAVVACYRTLKSMAGELARPNAPELRLAIMGADSAKADGAEQRLRETAGKYLSRPIGAAVRIDKIGACSTQSLYRGRLNQPLEALLKRAAARSGATPRAAGPSLNPISFMAATGVRPTPMAKPVAPARTEVAPRLPALPGGLAAIGLSCPYAARLTLCADGAGALHLVASRIGAASTTLDQDVAALLQAASWADAHADLLEAASGGKLRRVREAGPVLHLVTTDARGARPLLDTGVRVHLATPLPEGWATHELN